MVAIAAIVWVAAARLRLVVLQGPDDRAAIEGAEATTVRGCSGVEPSSGGDIIIGLLATSQVRLLLRAVSGFCRAGSGLP